MLGLSREGAVDVEGHGFDGTGHHTPEEGPEEAVAEILWARLVATGGAMVCCGRVSRTSRLAARAAPIPDERGILAVMQPGADRPNESPGVDTASGRSNLDASVGPGEIRAHDRESLRHSDVRAVHVAKEFARA